MVNGSLDKTCVVDWSAEIYCHLNPARFRLSSGIHSRQGLHPTTLSFTCKPLRMGEVEWKTIKLQDSQAWTTTSLPWRYWLLKVEMAAIPIISKLASCDPVHNSCISIPVAEAFNCWILSSVGDRWFSRNPWVRLNNLGKAVDAKPIDKLA